jgi:P27 family predicted phage terminase small subunit
MRGDKPKPAELKILRMTAAKAEKLARTITPTPGPLLDPPVWFTASQREAWQYAIDNAPRDVLKRIDQAALAGYIVAADLHRQATILLGNSQLLVRPSPTTLPQQNPYLPIINRQFVLMMRAATELGFTPCSRARIDAGKTSQPAGNPWDEVEFQAG